MGRAMIAVIIGIIALVVILLVASTMTSPPGSGTVVAKETCADTAVSYIKNNLVQPGAGVTLLGVTESKGMYVIRVSVQSQEYTLYATRDCSLLFPSALNMQAARATPAPTKAPVKSARPAVTLYTMGFCPYGTLAETAMRPVYNLLQEKADIRVRYITTVTGSTIDSVSSLHGPSEAREDAYQACLFSQKPDQFWDYLALFNNECYPLWQSSTALESCRRNVTTSLGIDYSALTTCATGPDGVALLKTDQAQAGSDNAYSSPTLIINGVKYSGARTPEAFKQAICNSFDTPPAECSTILSSASATATGSC